jgi:hypothetical protein
MNIQARVKKTRGRPIRAPKKGVRRLQLGLSVSAATKKVIDRIAQEQDVTLSRAAEMLIERCLQYDRTLKAMGTDLGRLSLDAVKGKLRGAGWTIEHGDPKRGIPDKWLEPGARPDFVFSSDEEPGQ